MSDRPKRRRSSRSRKKQRKTRHMLMCIVVAGACLGAILFVAGVYAENPVLKRISLLYLMIVAVLFCVWRALSTAAAEEEGES